MGNPGFIMVLYHLRDGRQEKKNTTKNTGKQLIFFQLIFSCERSIQNQRQRHSNEQVVQISPESFPLFLSAAVTDAVLILRYVFEGQSLSGVFAIR